MAPAGPVGKRCPVIGLVGGIGSGKSAVAGIFRGLGAVVIDADAIAHDVLRRPGVIKEIAETFGRDVLEEGAVSRPRLAAKAFNDKSLIDKLNRIIHPAVIEETRQVIESERGGEGRGDRGDRGDRGCGVIVIDAPLLFEAGVDQLCDVIVLVDASDEVRKRRLADKRGWAWDEVLRREKFQDSLISKRRRADYIIDNNGPFENAAAQIARLLRDIAGDRPTETPNRPAKNNRPDSSAR